MLKEAIIFTVGCSILVTNAILCFLPYMKLGFQLPSAVVYVEAVLSVMSCSLFLIGSCFSFAEAVYWTRGKWLSWKLEQNLASNKANPETSYESDIEKAKESPANDYGARAEAVWAFLPTADEMCHLGVAACMIFLFSSIVYWSCSIISLVTTLTDGQVARWIRYPQLVAAIGFAVASILLILKAQDNWWHPAFRSLAWHVNFWNLVGSAGFIFCSGFGLMQNVYWAQYQFGCSYLWGK